MSRGVETRGKKKCNTEKGHISPGMDEMECNVEQVETPLTATIRLGLDAISKEVRDLKAEMKTDLNTLKEQVKSDVKSELNELKQEIYQQLSANTKTIQTHETRINEAEERIEEMETWSLEAKDTLCRSLKQQRLLQDKLTDIEGRSRRNNIHIFGIPEDKEGDSATKFVEQLFISELSLLPDVNLQIQRAHRAIAQKPNRNAPPRSMVVNFQRDDPEKSLAKENRSGGTTADF